MMRKLRATHMREGDLEFAYEMMDMLNYQITQAETFSVFAKDKVEQIEWRMYELTIILSNPSLTNGE